MAVRKFVAILVAVLLSGTALAAPPTTFLPEPDRKASPTTIAKIALSALRKKDASPVFVRLDDKQAAAVREVTNSKNAVFGYGKVARWFADEGCGRLDMAMAQEGLGQVGADGKPGFLVIPFTLDLCADGSPPSDPSKFRAE